MGVCDFEMTLQSKTAQKINPLCKERPKLDLFIEHIREIFIAG